MSIVLLVCNPCNRIWAKGENVAFYCIAVTLQCDPSCRSHWAVTLYYTVASIVRWRQQRSIFFSPPGLFWKAWEHSGWWLHLYGWRSPAHMSVLCTVPSLTSWPDRASSTPPIFMNHAHTPCSTVRLALVAGRLFCCSLSLFVQSIVQLKMSPNGIMMTCRCTIMDFYSFTCFFVCLTWKWKLRKEAKIWQWLLCSFTLAAWWCSARA